MKQLLLVTLLLLSVRPVYAEWMRAAQDEDGMTVYIDPDTIRLKRGLVRVWHLFDYKTAQTVMLRSFLSSKAHIEYDCAEERSRYLAFAAFSDNMGSGEVVYSNPDELKWEPVEPESVGQILWKAACGKK